MVGAGFSGLYALYRLRGLGLTVVGLEAGDGVGGTWYWNRYPGARVDIESMQYSYSFDDDLQQEWRWPEYFSPQADLEAYANHVADRFGLRELIRFGPGSTACGSTSGPASGTYRPNAATRSPRSTLSPPPAPWTRPTSRTSRPRLVPRPVAPHVAMAERGRVFRRAAGRAHRHRVDRPAGGDRHRQVRRHLYVFQRTPAYSLPANNRPLPADYEREWKEHYPQRRAEMRQNFAAGYLPVPQYGSVFDYTPEERAAILEQAWAQRNGLLFLRTFTTP